MRVLAHLDPVVLEQELVSRIDAGHPTDAPGRTLVITPTRRLALQVQRRLTERRAAWIGVEVLDLQHVTRNILEQTGARLELLTPRLRERLLVRVMGRLADNPWTRFTERRPGTLRRLTGAIDDLREAGIMPGDLIVCATGGALEQGLAALYRGYVDEIDRLAESGHIDDAGLVEHARDGAESFAGAFGAIFLHGAYELNWIQLELIRALDAGCELTALIPAAEGKAVAEYANVFAERYLVGEGRPVESAADPDPGQRIALDSLYEEESRPEPAPAGVFHFRHTQGAAAEVQVAVREALAAIGEGCSPREIAIVARSLAPYETVLEDAFESERLPWTSSLSSPLRRQPVVHDLLLMLRVIDEDFPRAATVELLTSPRIDWAAILEGELPPQCGEIERWSRSAGIVGGLEEWTRELLRWAGRVRARRSSTDEEREEHERQAQERLETVTQLGEMLRKLRSHFAPERPRSWSEHAGNLAALLDASIFPAGASPRFDVLPHLRKLTAEMAAIENVVGEPAPVSFGEMRGFVEDAANGTDVTLCGDDDGGIRVLDAMQLRGMTFDRIHVLGMNSGQFPMAHREDPVLRDTLRERLQKHTGHALPLKSSGSGEERLLLALVLGSARDHIDVSWQRADESGKARTPSLSLREIARLAFGRPDIAEVRAAARHIRSHPTQALEDLLARPALLSDNDQALLAALHSRGDDDAMVELGRRFADLAPGLRMLRATQSFRPDDGAFDGRIGDRVPPVDSISVSDVGDLGGCPLRYFFRTVLRVRPLDDEIDIFETSPRDLGSSMHAALESVYRRLEEEGLFARADIDAIQARASELLRQGRRHLLGEIGARLAPRLPLLRDRLIEGWSAALEAFVHFDLASILSGGWQLSGVEESVESELDFGNGVTLTVRGRFDRVLEQDGSTLVADYKTSGKIEKYVDQTEMLKGHRFQMPLYRMMGGGDALVQVLGVGPNFPPMEEGSRPMFDGFVNDEVADGFLETMQIVVGLLREGRFPLNLEAACKLCDFRSACRSSHVPTRDREQAMRDSARYRMLEKKSRTRLPILGDSPTGIEPKRQGGTG